jgi:hypothetical protein
VIIFSNQLLLKDYLRLPNLKEKCLKNSLFSQCIIKSFNADMNAETQLKDQIRNLALLPAIYDPVLEGFLDFDMESKVDVLLG